MEECGPEGQWCQAQLVGSWQKRATSKPQSMLQQGNVGHADRLSPHTAHLRATHWLQKGCSLHGREMPRTSDSQSEAPAMSNTDKRIGWTDLPRLKESEELVGARAGIPFRQLKGLQHLTVFGAAIVELLDGLEGRDHVRAAI